MKKSLLCFFMLILCIGLLPGGTFAQDAPGTSGAGSLDESAGSVDGAGVNTFSAPPPYVTNLKRNNGNGTTEYGSAEARLNFTKNVGNIGAIQLIGITYIADAGKSVSNLIMFNGCPSYENGYYGYSLQKNIIPAKKLMFHFKKSDGSCFSIPEN
ncbi:MAG: hypothetical protein JWN83_2136 [Chitinophagaceae bacterium]|nr:hypothetical protein [Chitinophagaceae bacterium]